MQEDRKARSANLEETAGAREGALRGIRVVEVGTNIVVPLCSQTLGDAGADVVKIETQAGDQVRMMGPSRNSRMGSMFLGVNRNKRSVVLDLKSSAGKQALHRLLEKADVFVHSMRPTAIARLGLDYETLAPAFPRLIYASGPGYRSDGPYRNRAAYDDTIQGHSGVAGAIERANGEMRYMPTPIADKLCGNILATAVVMALFARIRTGRGQEVQVPMFENTVAFMLADQMWGASFDPPHGRIGSPRIFSPHRRPLKTLDGYVCIMVVTDDQWQRLFGLFGCPQLLDLPQFKTLEQRMLNIDDIYKIVADNIALRTTAEWIEKLEATDIPNAPAHRVEDLPADPYLLATNFFEKYDHPTEGALVRTPITMHFSETPSSIGLPPPPLGAHTRDVLAEYGFSDAEIERITGSAEAASPAH